LATVPSDPVPFCAAADGVLVRVLIAQKASRNSALATAQGVSLKVRVTAPSDRGKANQTFIKLLAKARQLPPNRFSSVAGNTDGHKTILLADDYRYLSPDCSNGRETPHDRSAAN
jgi:uncharacterized protein (TIGR00251 family)